jgi:hypothetical protein
MPMTTVSADEPVRVLVHPIVPVAGVETVVAGLDVEAGTTTVTTQGSRGLGPVIVPIIDVPVAVDCVSYTVESGMGRYTVKR